MVNRTFLWYSNCRLYCHRTIFTSKIDNSFWEKNDYSYRIYTDGYFIIDCRSFLVIAHPLKSMVIMGRNLLHWCRSCIFSHSNHSRDAWCSWRTVFRWSCSKGRCCRNLQHGERPGLSIRTFVSWRTLWYILIWRSCERRIQCIWQDLWYFLWYMLCLFRTVFLCLQRSKSFIQLNQKHMSSN